MKRKSDWEIRYKTLRTSLEEKDQGQVFECEECPENVYVEGESQLPFSWWSCPDCGSAFCGNCTSPSMRATIDPKNHRVIRVNQNIEFLFAQREHRNVCVSCFNEMHEICRNCRKEEAIRIHEDMEEGTSFNRLCPTCLRICVQKVHNNMQQMPRDLLVIILKYVFNF